MAPEIARGLRRRELHAELHQFPARESFERSWSAAMCHNHVQLSPVTQKPAVLRVRGWSLTSQEKGPELFLVRAAVAPLVGPGVTVEGGGRGGTGGSEGRW